MKLYSVRVLFIVLVPCGSIRQSVRQCTDCLSAHQFKEFVAYYNQYTIITPIFALLVLLIPILVLFTPIFAFLVLLF